MSRPIVLRMRPAAEAARYLLDHGVPTLQPEAAVVALTVIAEDLIDEVAAAEARGFARAVAALRDDDRYRNWWSKLQPDHPEYGYWEFGRKQLAAYLEHVASDGSTE